MTKRISALPLIRPASVPVAEERVLGIDPGLGTTGYGVIAISADRLVHLVHGEIKTDVDEPMPARLAHIFNNMSELINTWRPTAVAAESVFVHRNAGGALKLGHARGAALVACARFDLPIAEYTPTQVKQTLTGRGRANKEQVQYMIHTLLNLRAVRSLDASDALAVAVCHWHHAGNRLTAAIREHDR